ncbi:MAG: hypothetical protein QOH91_3256 [Mycobacterium sp.]|nr:hypothetical protein [Mycobacterium sp.]
MQFESLLEREYLLAPDATVDVVAITAQPLALLWPHGSPGERNHVPDFFVRLTSGDGRPIMVNVAEPDRKITPRTMLLTIVGIGLFLAFVTFIAGELDRLYSGDHNYRRIQIALIAYAGLWTPCTMALSAWRGARIFGSFEKFSDFNRQAKTSEGQSKLDVGTLRRIIGLQRDAALTEYCHFLLNVAIVFLLVAYLDHWVTAAWFSIGAATAFWDIVTARKRIRILAAEANARGRKAA